MKKSKHRIGKKVLALFMALMCIATIGVVSASAKTTSFDNAFNRAYHSAMNNPATYDRANWSGSHLGKNNQNLKTGMVINTYSHPKAGYAKQYKVSVNDKSGKYAYVQRYGVKNGSSQPQKIGHAQRMNIVYG